LISQTIHIEEQSLGLFYDKIYWDLIWGGAQSATFSGQLSGRDDLIPMILETTDFEVNKLKIMEVGCGQGDPITKLGDALKTRYDLSLIECDYSTEALELAKERGIKTIQGGMDALLEEGLADILILSHVFEHFVDLNKSMEINSKLTHDNSIIYVEVPGVNDLKNKSEFCMVTRIIT
jgi:2-polyprenyl-3-methyl-5-hydroxy-6-metoxy-1,4-benzoquinol methylase